MRSLRSIYHRLPAVALIASMAVTLPAGASTALDTKAGDTRIKSCREWKSERIQAAITKVTQTRTQLQISKSKDPNLVLQKGATEANSGSNIEKLEAQLQADQHVLETAKNFSVTDCLAGYLMKIQNKKAAFNEAAGKLTAEEIADLMSAYATSAFGNTAPELPPTANSMSEDRVR